MTSSRRRPKALAPVYDPSQVEERIYTDWLAADAFRVEIDPERQAFTIVIPPPNVTGSLHIGHALDNTIQDLLIRRRWMQGYATLWLPGTDHAGIATQYVVERRLAEEGMTLQQMGREEFLERAWLWKEEYEATILGQLQRLGASCDWSRTRFTLDEGLSRAVRQVFVGLYEKGLLYRDNYMVNWCPRCRTTLADLEVEYDEQEGFLYHVRYQAADGRSLTVATTRPETILGDLAVAVHPDDERYRDMVGQTVTLPIVNREIPVLADDFVDPDFGTGAVKITPSHDMDDFAVGLRHGLGLLEVIDEEGKMTAAAGTYAGLDRYECRQALLADLEAAGHLVQAEPHEHAVGTCYRCDTVVEPRVSLQWFVKMKPLAAPALAAVETGETKLVPDNFVRVYRHWLKNIRDWPISRQLWWGHRIPAWHCSAGHVNVAMEQPESCTTCGRRDLEQEEDVLDTWFSSALWPFSTLGWPDATDDLQYFYPTTVLVTGYDILFFWVARMMMMGIEFMGRPPFGTVLLHGLVRDAQGRKMSKSRGNTVDPLEVVEHYGADALRWALTAGTAPGNDVRLSDDRFQGARNFVNKLWNASRFVLMQVDGQETGLAEAAATLAPGAADKRYGPPPANLSWADRWILTRLHHTIERVDHCLDRYELAEAAHVLHEFVWSEFCDWYIELSKPALQAGAGPGQAARWTLVTVLDRILRLLHPVMPFVTEEIWQQLPGAEGFLMHAPWPRPQDEINFPQAADFATVQNIVRTIRGLRTDLQITTDQKVDLVLQTDAAHLADLLDDSATYICRLAGVEQLTVQSQRAGRPDQAVAAVVGPVAVYMLAADVIDLEREAERLGRELQAAESRRDGLAARLANERFTRRAPAEVVEKERQRLADSKARIARLEELLAQLQ